MLPRFGIRWSRRGHRPFRQAHPVICECVGPCIHLRIIPSMPVAEITRRIGG